MGMLHTSYISNQSSLRHRMGSDAVKDFASWMVAFAQTGARTTKASLFEFYLNTFTRMEVIVYPPSGAETLKNYDSNVL